MAYSSSEWWTSAKSNDSSSGDFSNPYGFAYGNFTWGGSKFEVPFYFYIVFVVWVLLFLLGVFGNGFVIYLFSRKRSLRTTRNSFFLNYCIVNLLVFVLGVAGGIPIQFYPGGGEDQPVKEQLCNLHSTLNFALMVSSLMLLVCSSVDRYIAIHYPFKNVITPSRAKLLVVISWLYGLATAAPPIYYFSGHYDVVYSNKSITVCGMKIQSISNGEVTFCTALAVYGVILPVSIVCFCYTRILRTAWNHIRSQRLRPAPPTVLSREVTEGRIAMSSSMNPDLHEHESLQCDDESNVGNPSCSSVAQLQLRNVHVQVANAGDDRKRKLKGAITVLLIVSVMLLSWIPYVVLQGVYLATLSSGSRPSTHLSYMATISITYPCIGAAVSPFVFGFRTAGFTEEFMKLFRLVFCCRRQNN